MGLQLSYIWQPFEEIYLNPATSSRTTKPSSMLATKKETHRCRFSLLLICRRTVVFKFFWRGCEKSWGLGEALFLLFIAFFWPSFLKSFYEVHEVPPPPFPGPRPFVVKSEFWDKRLKTTRVSNSQCLEDLIGIVSGVCGPHKPEEGLRGIELKDCSFKML